MSSTVDLFVICLFSDNVKEWFFAPSSEAGIMCRASQTGVLVEHLAFETSVLNLKNLALHVCPLNILFVSIIKEQDLFQMKLRK